MDRVNYFEIPVDDFDRAKKFYQKIFSWDIKSDSKLDDRIYRTINTQETDGVGKPVTSFGINGDFFKRGNDGNEHVSIVINVPSVDGYLKKIQENGGKIALKKRKIADYGHYGQFIDTEGNRIGLWEN